MLEEHHVAKYFTSDYPHHTIKDQSVKGQLIKVKKLFALYAISMLALFHLPNGMTQPTSKRGKPKISTVANRSVIADNGGHGSYGEKDRTRSWLVNR